MQSAEILKPGARVCLVGIGGISMSSLAFELRGAATSCGAATVPKTP